MILLPPNRYASIHNHSTFSPFDGLSEPREHIDFCLKNGLDSWSLTDHGNGNGLAHAHAHAKKLKGKGAKFRQLYGVEFYFVPDLKEWKKAYDLSKGISAEDSTSENDEEEAGLVVEDADDTRTEQIDNISRRYHLVVVAKNRVGLSNLFTLVKKSFKDGFYKFPRIDFNMLKEHGEGLVVSTACVGGYPSGIIYREFPDLKFDQLDPRLVDDETVRNRINNRLQNMVDRFTDCVGRDNFFLEIQFNRLGAQDLTNRCMIDLSQRTGIPLLTTSDAHYPGPDLWEAREIYRQLQPGRMKIGEEPKPLPTKDQIKAELFPKNADQMWEEYLLRRKEFKFYEGTEDVVRSSIERGHDIAWQMCEEIWFEDTAKLPSFSTSESTAMSQLTSLVKTALIDEGLATNKEYVERAKFELGDIKHLGFENYFLTLQKVFKVAENRTLPGAGRGSGAGSLVNYLLGITHVDPMRYDLLWERFLGRHRAGWPDIDTDVGNRDALIDAAREIFGEESVVPVSNFNTLKLKSLVKDVSKFYGIPFDEVNAVTGPLEREVAEKSRDPNMEKSMFVLKHEDCLEHSPRYREFMEKYPQVEDKVRALFMMNRSIGRHAGGVLVCPELEKHMPLITVRGELQTPWTEGVNIRNLEENGFLKFDFLGLKQMQMVEDCIRRILRRETGKEPTFKEVKKFYDDKLNCRYVDPNDHEVFKFVYQAGRWPGIFQFTSDGARRFCISAQPENIVDLSTITAIYRPGPLKADVHKKYVEAKKNRAAIKYDHPVIEEILGPTCGFIVFQEQFMLLAQKLAGFSPGDSDKMRKTLVKKDLTSLGKKSDEKEALEKKFISGCIEKSGLSKKQATDLFETIAFFSLYGFNKSHSVAYAIDSYYGAWLMTYYEKDWLATCLQTENRNVEGLAVVMSEIKQQGYKISPPDINSSSEEWSWSDELDSFVPPLSSLKGVGDSAVDEIIENRPYRNMDELLFDEEGNWKHSKLNRRCFEALLGMEAFTSLEEFKSGKVNNHKQLHEIIIGNYGVLRKGRWGMSAKKAAKTNAPPVIETLIESTQCIEDWTRTEKVALQAEISGAAPHHIMFPEEIMGKIRKVEIPAISEIEPGNSDIAWFCVIHIEKKSTKTGKTFLRLKVVDSSLKTSWIRVWGDSNDKLVPYSIWMANVNHEVNWGISTNIGKMKYLDC
jgi:DNA polymerase-3 subunit alpha